MTTVHWVDPAGAAHENEIDLQAALRVTPDVDGDLGATVAALIAKNHMDLSPYANATGPTIVIDEPGYVSGSFAVSISRTVRDPEAPPNERIRSYAGATDATAMADNEVTIGVLGRRLSPLPSAEWTEVHRNLLRMTPPDQVKFSYERLGNIYGHHISGSRTDEEEQQLDVLRKLYDDAVLHDRGWAVRSKVTGGIGFLAVSDPPVEELTDRQVEEFTRANGVVPQIAIDWVAHTAMVCFVPMEKIGDAVAIMDALEDLSSARPAP